MNRIDYSRLCSLTARQVIRALRRDGFNLEGQTGSHQRYYHSDGRRVTASFHQSGETFAPRILRIMIQDQARMDRNGLEEVGPTWIASPYRHYSAP